MNTLFNPVNYLMIAFLTLISFPYAVIALRMIRRDAIAAYRVYKWTQWSRGDEEWSHSNMARAMSGLNFTWPMLSLVPRFSLPGEKEALEFVKEAEFEKRHNYAHRDQKWSADKEDYLIVRHRFAWGQTRAVFFLALFFVVLIGGGLWLNAHPVSAAEAPTTPAPTQVVAPTSVVPTSAPLSTATPAPEVEVTNEGDALVVDLDRDVPPSEFWRRVNEALNATCEFCPPIPTIPIPDWVWDIIGDWEFTIIRLPEGMDGYIVAYQTPYGMAVQRVDDQFDQIGNPEALAESEVTIAARDRRFGIGYSNKGWDKPINRYRGNTVLTVTESGGPAMIVEARGFAYNFRLWHIAVVIILIVVGVVVYRRIY